MTDVGAVGQSGRGAFVTLEQVTERASAGEVSGVIGLIGPSINRKPRGEIRPNP